MPWCPDFRTAFPAGRKLFALALLAATVCGPATAPSARAGTSSSLMEISTDGTLLACSNRDSGTVTIVDLKSRKKLREIPVGHKPEGVTFLGTSHRLAVAVYGDDNVTVLDADTGEIAGRVEVFDEPYGIVCTPDGHRLYVTLDYPGQILKIDPAKLQIEQTIEGAGKFLRGLALDPAAGRLYVTEYYTAVVRAVATDSGKVVDEWKGASTDNLCRQVVLHPTRAKAYVPHIRSKVNAVHGQGSIFPYLAVLDTDAGEGRRRKRIPMDAFRGALVTANPWEVAVSPDAKRLYIVFAGTDDMFVCNLLDDNYREVADGGYLRLGRNPRAVQVSPDSSRFYVYNALDFTVDCWDAKSLRKVASITVTDNPLSEELLLGKVLFYSAQQPMSGRKWISCSSCHPDGEPDGRTWHNPEGLRNTQSLAGMAWTHPIHWSADRDEVQDFEHTIRGPLMQGQGLVRGRLNDSLGSPNGRLSAALDALAAYSNSHKVPLSPHAKGGLSAAAQRGRALFLSDRTGCVKCHQGPYYCDSKPGPADSFLLHDVGTGNDDPSEKMGPKYDTPTLLGLYRTAPYLHHGRARTLEEVLTTQNPNDRHGTTSGLNPREIADLVEFLRSLPYEDPEPAAVEAGLKKIAR